MRENNIERQLKAQSIAVKLRLLIDNERFLRQQIELLETTANNYSRLLQAEYLKLNIGESSVFLINAREMKYLEYREKLINTQVDILENRLQVIRQAAILF